MLLTDLDVAATHEYLFVVDFAAIYAYMYRTIMPGTPPTIPGDPSERSYARGLLALDFIFSGKIRPLLLIPPYAFEISSHLKFMAMKVENLELNIGSEFRERLSHTLESSEEFANFLRLSPSVALTEGSEGYALQNAALEIGRKYFPELYSVVTVLTSNGVEKLKDLFRKSIITEADAVIPECRKFIYSGSHPGVDKWYKKMLPQRAERRAFQTFIDAMACEYIPSANAELNRRGRVVVFVSPSRAVQNTLEEEAPCITINGRPAFGLVRDVIYFLLSLTHNGDRRKIRFSLDTVNALLQIYSDASEGRIKKALYLFDRAEEKWKLAENLLLMTESLSPAPSAEPGATHDHVFLNLLKALHEAVQANRPELESEIAESFTAFRGTILELKKAIPCETTIDWPDTVLPIRHLEDEE